MAALKRWNGTAWEHVGTAASGGGTGDLSYVFTQATPAATWVIAHNLGKHPSVTVVDSAGSVVEGDVRYVDANTLVLEFGGGGFGGTAYLN